MVNEINSEYKEVIQSNLHDFTLIRNQYVQRIEAVENRINQIEKEKVSTLGAIKKLERYKGILFILLLLTAFSFYPFVVSQELVEVTFYKYMASAIPIILFFLFYLFILKGVPYTPNFEAILISLQNELVILKTNLEQIDSIVNKTEYGVAKLAEYESKNN